MTGLEGLAAFTGYIITAIVLIMVVFYAMQD